MARGWCEDKRKCFAKVTRDAKHYECLILVTPFYKKPCPFCKPERDVTDGKTYIFDEDYGKKHKETTES